jgi:hypothetical protein
MSKKNKINLNNLNIELITQKKITENKNILDANSLSSSNKKYEEANLFDSNMIIKKRKKRYEKMLDIYMKYYTICIDRIKLLTAKNQTDLIYDIPPIILDCPEYSCKECIKFIEEKLRNIYFDTLIMSPTRLFITWKYIELNTEEQKE